VIFAASGPEIIEKLNSELKLGLTPDEIKSLPRTRTIVKSARFGTRAGKVKIMDDTVFETEKAVFLAKGGSAEINVDGSKGAQLNSKNGIILQMMDNDDPGPRDADGKRPTSSDGKMYNTGVYTEPAAPPVRDKKFDVTTPGKSDVMATFANIALKGDFYNGCAVSGGTGGMMGLTSSEPTPLGKNLVLKLENSKITGVVTASTAKHAKSTITSEDYLLIGEVTNTPSPVVNNGVIVSLAGSTWTVTGISYLTCLSISNDSSVNAPEGYKLTMRVNGAEKAIRAGTYKGNIVLTITKS
jgi:hypothetical protein